MEEQQRLGFGRCEKKKPSIDGAHHMARVIRCTPVAQWTEPHPGSMMAQSHPTVHPCHPMAQERGRPGPCSSLLSTSLSSWGTERARKAGQLDHYVMSVEMDERNLPASSNNFLHPCNDENNFFF